MPLAHIAAINLDCADPLPLARFWAAMLGGDVAVETPDFCAVTTGTLFIGAVRTDGHEPPTWPSAERSQQVHLDLTVDTDDTVDDPTAGDLDAAEREAIRLGATKESHQPSPDRSRVLRDPAGHPFCLRG